jgi:hypothetical protein
MKLLIVIGLEWYIFALRSLGRTRIYLKDQVPQLETNSRNNSFERLI